MTLPKRTPEEKLPLNLPATITVIKETKAEATAGVKANAEGKEDDKAEGMEKKKAELRRKTQAPPADVAASKPDAGETNAAPAAPGIVAPVHRVKPIEDSEKYPF